jgi:hypothetical protein
MKKILGRLISFFVVALFAAFGVTTTVQAGTDLITSCPAIGACTISPPGTPLFDESGWVPGSSVAQKITITNSSSQTGFAGIEVQNYSEILNLGQVIAIEIRRGSPAGSVIYSAANLHIFRDDGYFTIDTLTSGQTQDYYFMATMSPAAGNEYQGGQVRFDLKAGLEITPIVPPSGGGNGSGGSVAGTSTAQPPVCNDQAPSSAPSVTITNVGTNTVSLSWTAVSPVTHYGIFFTRNSDGAQYGAPNIGNVTTYTITNLSGGANYSFQVFGVNGCAPGPRSGAAASGQVPGPFIATRPVGGGGEVLGETTASPTPTPTPSASPSVLGQIAGTTTEICASWKRYVPWILLVVQFIIIFGVEYRYRYSTSLNKHIFAVLVTALSIFLFYWLRECPCYGEWNWLAWLCKWYWIVAIVLTLLVKGFSYAFLDESSEMRDKPKKPGKPENTFSGTKTESSPASTKSETKSE